MTTTAETPENAADSDENTPQAPQAPEDATQAPEADDEPRGAGREAAKYRTRLREVEAERDTLTEQLGTMRTAVLEQHLAGDITITVERDGRTFERSVRLAHPEDATTLGGIDPAAVWTEDGRLDVKNISAAIGKLHANRPDLFVPFARPVPGEGGNDLINFTPAFEAAFKPASQR